MATYTPDTIKLRARLEELGLSQRGAAAALGIGERTMRRYVQGDTPVPSLMWHALDGFEAMTALQAVISGTPDDLEHARRVVDRIRKLSAQDF